MSTFSIVSIIVQLSTCCYRLITLYNVSYREPLSITYNFHKFTRLDYQLYTNTVAKKRNLNGVILELMEPEKKFPWGIASTQTCATKKFNRTRRYWQILPLDSVPGAGIWNGIVVSLLPRSLHRDSKNHAQSVDLPRIQINKKQ